MPSKLLRVRTAVVAGLALLLIGGVAAAAAGPAPAPAERATQASPRTPDGQVGHAQGDAAILLHGPDGTAAANSSASDKPGEHAVGPDASGAAKHGLCRAWFAGQGDEHGRRADSTAFQALAAAAGGADQVAAYCDHDADTSTTHGRRPAAPPATPAPPTAGPPEDPGHGHGRGGERPQGGRPEDAAKPWR
jgi:hypothetical protein